MGRDGYCRFLVRFQSGTHLRIEVSIEADSQQRSKAIFAHLFSHRVLIEETLGYSLMWEEKATRVRSTIYANYPGRLDLHNTASSEAALEWATAQIDRLRAAAGAVPNSTV